MKTTRHFAAAALGLLLLAGAGQRASAQPYCQLELPDAPSNTVDIAITAYYPAPFTATSLFSVNLLNAVGPVAAGTYGGWCVDANTDITVAQKGNYTFYTGQLLCPCDTNLNSKLPQNHPATCYVDPLTWHKVNYLLNHQHGAFYWNVQEALNVFVGGPRSAHYYAPYGVPYYDPALIQTLVDDANANAASWRPQCGDKVGVILVTDSDWLDPLKAQQLVLIEVPYCCSTIGDFVWLDANGNGFQDSGEAGINGVTVQLTLPDGSTQTTVTGPAPVTGQAGYYQFTSICNGTYTVSIPPGQAPLANLIPTINRKSDGNITSVFDGYDSNEPAGTTLTLTGGDNPTIDFGYVLKPANAPLIVSCVSQTTGQVDVPYDASFSVIGGLAPYTFTVTAGALPEGLLLSPTSGQVVGTPTTAGTFDFEVTVTDAAGGSANQSIAVTCSITIAPPPLALVCASGSGQAGTPYGSTLVAFGGTPPYLFSITDGALPPGLNLDPVTGAIAGTPTNAGAFSYTAEVVDSAGNAQTASVSCGITIAPPPLVVACGTGAGQVDAPYNSALVATGGTPPYQFSITDGALPPGLTLDAGTGAITGTPTTAGAYPFGATVVDSAGAEAQTTTVSCNITIAPPPLVLVCAGVTGQVGTPYSSALVAFGGTPPYKFSIATGSLPPGLTLNTNTGAITGTPTAAGTFPYAAAVVDAGGDAVQTAVATCGAHIDACAGGNLCGHVYNDYDCDGSLDPDEPGIKGVIVTLKDSTGHVIATVATDVNGAYCFTGLLPGIYNVSVGQPTNCTQTAGTTRRHSKDQYNRVCWKENDGYVHWMDHGREYWQTDNGCTHWKDDYGRDCWKDRYGYTHSQECNYTKCDVPKNHTEIVTLAPCESNSSVDFAYTGTAPKVDCTVSGPTRARCGDWITYTCKIKNTGNVCFSKGCQVTVCGETFTCPKLNPGEEWSCQKRYNVSRWDYGNLTCHTSVNCYPAKGNSTTGQSYCTTSVGW